MSRENVREICFIAHQALYELCRSDVVRSLENLDQDPDDGFSQRTFVRAMFAFIEGDVWGRKTAVLLLHERSPRPTLSPSELLIASDESVGLKDDGTVRSGRLRSTLLPSVRFSFGVFAAAFGIQGYQLDVSDSGWSDLQEAVRVRDRLMHPKGGGDLKLSDNDIATCRRALGWYESASSRLSDLTRASVLHSLTQDWPSGSAEPSAMR